MVILAHISGVKVIGLTVVSVLNTAVSTYDISEIYVVSSLLNAELNNFRITVSDLGAVKNKALFLGKEGLNGIT